MINFSRIQVFEFKPPIRSLTLSPTWKIKKSRCQNITVKNGLYSVLNIKANLEGLVCINRVRLRNEPKLENLQTNMYLGKDTIFDALLN